MLLTAVCRPLLCVVIFILLFCSWSGSLLAQGTVADYERSEQFGKRTANKVTKLRIEPNWFDEDRQFWYRNDLLDGQCEFIVVHAEQGKRELAFDHTRFATAWNAIAKTKHDAARLPIQELRLNAERTTMHWLSQGTSWECDLTNYTVRKAAMAMNLAEANLLPSDLQLKRSGRQGAETEIRFDNHTSETVLLFWLNETGERQAYGRVKAGEQHAQHTYAGHVWIVTNRAEEILASFKATTKPGTAIITEDPVKPQEKKSPPGPVDDDLAQISPHSNDPMNRERPLFFKDHNVWWRGGNPRTEHAVTTTGTAENAFAGRIHYSPDGRSAVVMRTQPEQQHEVHLIESSPRDQVQPRLKTSQYLKPGDRIRIDQPHLIDLTTGKLIPVNSDLFANPWSIDHLNWTADSSEFRFIYNQRGHQVLRLLAINAQTGAVRTIIDEQSKTFIDYSGKFFLQHLLAKDEYLWMSERSGWNHLYLIDAKSAQVTPLTTGKWVVRKVEQVDSVKRQVWFQAAGLDAEQDPYFLHHCRINLDEQQMVRLTAGNGTHSVQYSPNKKWLIDSYSRVNQPPIHELRRTSDGELRCELERADWSTLVATGWRAPEPFQAVGRDGQTPIWGVICRPTNFDPQRKYPVIELIYAGPQSAFVPKKFSSWLGNLQAYAELGFIMVQIDGMGTSHRSKAFHDVCWKNLVDAGFPDRIRWLQAAAKHEPAMNLSRVGIFGGSAGGQNALGALLTQGDFYHVAVADCGCHDNRMDKIWWNEQWMGYPIGPHYAEQSNVTLAKNLRGRLFLTVGELDTNVDPASTMQVVNALIKANKDFDLLIVPGANHGVGESPYANRRRKDFFVRHLLHVEPRHDAGE